MNATEIFSRLTAAQSAGVLDWLAEHDRGSYKSCAAMLASRRKLRPVFVERKPRAERNQWMAEALVRPSNADLALEVLQAWTLGCNERVVCDFLDALSIPHNGKGVIDEVPAEPPAGSVGSAVEALLSKHGPAAVFVYLHLFADSAQGSWPSLEEILASNEAFATAKSPASA